MSFFRRRDAEAYSNQVERIVSAVDELLFPAPDQVMAARAFQESDESIILVRSQTDKESEKAYSLQFAEAADGDIRKKFVVNIIATTALVPFNEMPGIRAYGAGQGLLMGPLEIPEDMPAVPVTTYQAIEEDQIVFVSEENGELLLSGDDQAAESTVLKQSTARSVIGLLGLLD